MKFEIKFYLRILAIIIPLLTIGLTIWFYLLFEVNETNQFEALFFLSLVITLLFVLYPILKLLKEKKIEVTDGVWGILDYRSRFLYELNSKKIKEIKLLKMSYFNDDILNHQLIKIKLTKGKTISFHSREIKDFEKLSVLVKSDFQDCISVEEF